eukprot:SAG22_NODE_1663_length_3864_cov_2.633201_1_plen_338_part_00
MEQNLQKYLVKHPECEVYHGQDLPSYVVDTATAARIEKVRAAAAARPAKQIQKRVTLWHKIQKRKVVGNAAPLEKNVQAYLAKHPEFELFDASGDEREKTVARAVERVLGAIVTSVCSMHKQQAGGGGDGRRLQPKPSKRKQQSLGGTLAGGGGKASLSSRKRQKKVALLPSTDANKEGMSLLLSIAMAGGMRAGGASGASFLHSHSGASAPHTGWTDDADAEEDGSNGLLELLAMATASDKREQVVVGRGGNAATAAAAVWGMPAAAAAGTKQPVPAGSAAAAGGAPESPPFSPLPGPQAATAEQLIGLNSLVLGQSSPKGAAQSEHRWTLAAGVC